MSAKSKSPQVDDYIAKSSDFAKPIAAHLRKLLHQTCPEVVEVVKWGIPHFDYKGEMMCIFASYKSHCSFTFWKESLMTDPRLKANPTLAASKRFMGKLTAASELPSDKELVAYIKEAMLLNENGVKVSKPKSDAPKTIGVPDYFSKSLAANSQAKQIFEAKSDSFRKEYLVWITEAKTDATRQKRIEESIDWISQGKGRFWKYQK